MILYTRKQEVPFVVDDVDVNLVNQYTWSVAGGGYPMTHINKRRVYLHELLMGKAEKPFMWDHIDRNRLNNRRNNLRLVTNKENSRNFRTHSNNTSGITGVYWVKRKNKWMSYITVDKKMIGLGYFADKTVAAQARQEAEKRYWGKTLAE